MKKRLCYCDDYSRSAFLRRAAEAGSGLPGIEPGMPLPAGTGLTRRSFLTRSLGVALSVYGANLLSPRVFEEGIAQAATDNRVLVSIFMNGGADSLSMLYPTADPDYRRLRPKLALPGNAGPVFSEDDRLHWHPELRPLAELHGQGKVTVLPTIGYTNANQSHFTSRHYWELGATDADVRTGWLGRYLDKVGTPDNPLQGLSLDGYLLPALATGSVPVAATDGASYTLSAYHVWGKVETRMLEALEALGNSDQGGDANRTAAAAVLAQSHQLRRELLPFGDGSDLRPPVEYPTSDTDLFPVRLAGLAAMLAAGLPLRCVALSAPGLYDTHDSQTEYLPEGLRLTAASLAAFQRDLEVRGLADRVLVLVWSEFGRRAEENASNGTDHGAAGTGFILGSRVRGELVGEYIPLAQGLDADGNLRPTVDFRGIYAALLEQWFDVDAAEIIPNAGDFARPRLIR